MATVDFAERMKVIGARIREGRDTYAGRQDAWHLLGNVSGTFRTWKEMLSAASAAFSVVKLQLSFNQQLIDAYGTFRIDTTIPKGLEKEVIPFGVDMPDGTRAETFLTFLGTVGKDYQVIQHTDGFDLLDTLVGQIDGAHYETMGTLEFGRIVWGQIDPNISIKVAGVDETKALLSFRTSHDGSAAFDLWQAYDRIVCRNTYRAQTNALRSLAAKMRVRHTKNADKRIADLKMEIDNIRHVALTMEDRLTWLSQRRVTKDSLVTVMNRLFPPTKNDDGVEQSSSRRENILATILERYESNDNDAFPQFRGTAYNLLNSITEYTDHYRSSKENARAESAVFGSGDALKRNALDLIMGEAEKMPAMLSNQPAIAVDFADLGLNLNRVN